MPRQLGRYRILGELGRGAMGQVYLAHDPAIERKVALKTINLPDGLSEKERTEALTRFQREVRAAGALAHPNIITMYDISMDPGAGTFIAMEYVEGRSLEAYTEPGRLLDPRLAASITCQAADALSYAHAKGVVHRDIKPANLILVDDRTLKIADFGLAKHVGASATTDGTLLGTPYYMSPEQVRGAAVDGRSDLFSLAVVYYELLTAKTPFRGESLSTIIYRIVHEPPIEPDLSLIEEGTRIKQFLARALSKKPDSRFQTGDEFARALRESATPSSATTATAAPSPEKPASDSPPQPVPPVRPAGERPAGRPTSSRRARPASVARGRGGRPDRKPQPPRRKGARYTRPARRLSLMPFLIILLAGTIALFFYREPVFYYLLPPGPSLETEGGVEEGGVGAGSAAPPQAESAPEGAATGSEVPPRQDPDPPAEAGAAPAVETVAPPVVTTLVTLASRPQGAAFSIDDKVLPANRLPAPTGDETLTVHAVLGCHEASRVVSAEDAGTEVTLDLAPMSIEMSVASEPEGAAVQIDGKESGKAPVSTTLDGCAEHEVVVTRDGYKTWKRKLVLEDGRLAAPATLHATLAPLPRGTLRLPEPPFPVEMKLDGKQKLKSGQSLAVIAGTHRVSFSSRQLMFRKEVKVSVPADGTATPELDFPSIARLTVRTQPGNASLEIVSGNQSRDLGAPPLFGEELVAGTYTVKCTFKHNGEEQEQVVSLRGGDNEPVVFVAKKP